LVKVKVGVGNKGVLVAVKVLVGGTKVKVGVLVGKGGGILTGILVGVQVGAMKVHLGVIFGGNLSSSSPNAKTEWQRQKVKAKITLGVLGKRFLKRTKKLLNCLPILSRTRFSRVLGGKGRKDRRQQGNSDDNSNCRWRWMLIKS
jgi:hypothetical protein